MNTEQEINAIEEMEEETVVHFDKIAETLYDHDAVTEWSFKSGKVYVQFKEAQFADSNLIDELFQWGIDVYNVDFETNQIGFERRD